MATTDMYVLAAIIGAVLGLAGYFKNAQPGSPDWVKVIVNAVGGIVIGVIIVFETGEMPTEVTFILYLPAIAGYLTLVEYILKGLVRRGTNQPSLDLKFI